MGDTKRSDEEVRELLQRLRRGELPASERPEQLRGANLTGEDLTGADLSGVDLSGADLSGADLSGANLCGARLFRTRLKGATLTKADLTDAELTGADLTEADLEHVHARRAGLGRATLRATQLFEADLQGATLSLADLSGADLRHAKLQGARVREADLQGADLTGADLRGADLALSSVEGATFNNVDLRDARLRLVRGFRKASWIGVDIRDINFSGAYRMRRFIVDENYIKEYRESSRVSGFVYYLWWLTSDCGRSMSRWCGMILAQLLLFAGLFSLVAMDYGEHPTWLSGLYFSVVTLTTLGYGDVIPASSAAQAVAMLEVVTGYIMLGGLIAIFSNRVARRAD
jgi:uncharacterized protein YjbI with pentapeptide repeats